MYSAETIIIPIGFIITSSLLLWLIIGVRGWWLIKLFMITGTLLFSLSVWSSVNSYMGWPTSQPLPEQFEFHWAKVREPSKETGQDGYICLWITEVGGKDKDSKNLFEYENKLREPRAYRVPYSMQEHQNVRNAMQLVKKGKRVMGNNQNGMGGKGKGKGVRGNGDGAGNGRGRMTGRGKKGQQGYAGEANGGFFILYELPPPKYPEKDPEE